MRENRRPVTARHNSVEQKVPVPLFPHSIGACYLAKQQSFRYCVNPAIGQPTPIRAQPVSGGLSDRRQADSTRVTLTDHTKQYGNFLAIPAQTCVESAITAEFIARSG